MRLEFRVFAALLMILGLSLTIPQGSLASKNPPSKAKKVPTRKKETNSKAAKKVDHNGIGFKAFQKGDFKSALKSFELSIKTDPKNAFGYLNHARTLIALNIKSDPDDYCAYESNWVLLALASLSKSMEVGKKVVIGKLKEIKEPSFLEFKKRPEYKKWESALLGPFSSDQQLKSFVLTHAEWVTRDAGMPPTMVTLRQDFTMNVQKPDGQNAEGRWRIENGKVVLESQLLSKSLSLKTIPFYFNEGRSFISSTILVDEKKETELFLGPVTDDCS
ncbi:MAG: hypothetical protein U1E10_09315 [Bdellovibrionales bacterium]|nr:hypothetical protein [Bdellovibrionales bacterium]